MCMRIVAVYFEDIGHVISTLSYRRDGFQVICVPPFLVSRCSCQCIADSGGCCLCAGTLYCCIWF